MNRLYKLYRKQAADALRDFRKHREGSNLHSRGIYFGKYVAYKSAAWNLRFEQTIN